MIAEQRTTQDTKQLTITEAEAVLEAAREAARQMSLD